MAPAGQALPRPALVNLHTAQVSAGGGGGGLVHLGRNKQTRVSHFGRFVARVSLVSVRIDHT